MEDIKGKELIDDTPIENVDNNNNKVSDDLESDKQPAAESEKKYGGLLPKKIPLISKDHERAWISGSLWISVMATMIKT
ncbi:unnamed protein product [Cochlearia groenlandica]